VTPTETPLEDPAEDLPFPVQASAFSWSGSRVAFVTMDGRMGVFDRRRGPLFRSDPTEDHYTELSFDPSGRFISYQIKHFGQDAQAGVLDLDTGIMKTLEGFPSGPRYASADGRRLLVVACSAPPGLAELFDTSAPSAPVLLAKYSVPVGIYSAAVSEDGRLVAVQHFEESSRLLCSVVLLDESLRTIGEPLVTGLEAKGVQFQGNFLFVGLQWHPIPVSAHWFSSTDILLFDLRQPERCGGAAR
jgi:hypothetical protein